MQYTISGNVDTGSEETYFFPQEPSTWVVWIEKKILCKIKNEWWWKHKTCSAASIYENRGETPIALNKIISSQSVYLDHHQWIHKTWPQVLKLYIQCMWFWFLPLCIFPLERKGEVKFSSIDQTMNLWNWKPEFGVMIKKRESIWVHPRADIALEVFFNCNEHLKLSDTFEYLVFGCWLFQWLFKHPPAVKGTRYKNL